MGPNGENGKKTLGTEKKRKTGKRKNGKEEDIVSELASEVPLTVPRGRKQKKKSREEGK